MLISPILIQSLTRHMYGPTNPECQAYLVPTKRSPFYSIASNFSQPTLTLSQTSYVKPTGSGIHNTCGAVYSRAKLIASPVTAAWRTRIPNGSRINELCPARLANSLVLTATATTMLIEKTSFQPGSNPSGPTLGSLEVSTDKDSFIDISYIFRNFLVPHYSIYINVDGVWHCFPRFIIIYLVHIY